MDQLTDIQKKTFMRRAIELSKEAFEKNEGGPYGAVVVKNGEIVGEGHNRQYIEMDLSRHGEVVAIANATKALNSSDLSQCILFTSAHPCEMCAVLIFYAKIKKIYFGVGLNTEHPFFERVSDFAKAPFSTGGPVVKEQLLAEEATSVHRKFYQMKPEESCTRKLEYHLHDF